MPPSPCPAPSPPTPTRITYILPCPAPPPPHTDYLAAIYAEMRQLEKSQQEVSSTYTTPRSLLSIIRVAMALAKLRFDTQVGRDGRACVCGGEGGGHGTGCVGYYDILCALS